MNPTEILNKSEEILDVLYMLVELKEHIQEPIKQKMIMATICSPILESTHIAMVAREMISEIELVYELSGDSGLKEIFHQAGFTNGVEREFKNRIKLVEIEMGKQNEVFIKEHPEINKQNGGI